MTKKTIFRNFAKQIVFEMLTNVLIEACMYRKVTVRFSEGPFFRRFIVPKVHCSEGSLFRKKGLLCRRFIGPKGHLSEIGVPCSEGSLF